MSQRIVFVGAPSSGKTSLTTAVFTALKQAGRKVEHVHEFIRFDINQNGAMTSIWEQYRTRQFQKELEDGIPAVADHVICDAGTISPYFYAVLYADPTESRQRLVLQDMYKYLLDDLYLRRYDLVFYLPLLRAPDLKDGTRYQTDREVQELDDHMRLMFTVLHKLPNIHVVQSGYERRLEECMWRILGVDYFDIKSKD